MTFLTVLLTLFVERFVQRQWPQREHRWFDHYCRRLAGTPFTQWVMSRRWGAVAIVLPPLLLIAWLQTLFNGLGSLFGLIFGFVILLYSLGPRELGTEVESFLTARDRGNEGQANSLADDRRSIWRRANPAHSHWYSKPAAPATRCLPAP